ncbi:NrsF family protein [Ensifer soli]|uniref:NrsF family protein n=1 Tax=Ciceribacter sp. sgz301302 TaxID=3342379 RepID=UPI0035BA750F
MKTDELIRMLAQDAPVRLRFGRVMMVALVAGAAVSVMLLVVTVGLRHDLVTVFETARVMVKIGATLLLAVLSARLAIRIGRPGTTPGRDLAMLAVPAAVLALAVILEMIAVPAAEWKARWLGLHAAFCVVFVPVLALAPLVALLAALRHGAPEDPGSAGAAAGLAAGTIAAAVYAWHCPDDSPLFVVTWYAIGIAVVVLAGFLAGRRVLVW